MYIFECCLRPTSGCECVWNRIRTYGAAKPHGRLTACCLKPLGHPNILAGTEDYDTSTPCLTDKRSASELRSKIKLKYLQDSYLSMIATYISFPLFGLNGLCIPQINSNFFEPSVGFKPTVRISILITSQAESFTVPRRQMHLRNLIFHTVVG